MQNSKPFIVRQNSSGQENYAGFLIDLIEELSEAANVSKVKLLLIDWENYLFLLTCSVQLQPESGDQHELHGHAGEAGEGRGGRDVGRPELQQGQGGENRLHSSLHEHRRWYGSCGQRRYSEK